VWLGAESRRVEKILDDAVIGPADAGIRSERRVTVELDNGEVLVLHRPLPDGEWKVYRQLTTAAADAPPIESDDTDNDDRR
jgi:hypothetical protein